MIHKTAGVVLSQYKYGESSLIVNVYTHKFGRQSYIVKGGHSRRSRSRSNLMRPLFLLDMEVYHREGKDIQTLKEIKLSYTFLSLPYDIYKSTQALFLAEVLSKVLREEESNTALFDFIVSSIHFLDLTRESVANFHIFFLLRLTRFLGILPQENYGENTPCFDLSKGRFVSSDVTHSQCLNRELSEYVVTFLRTSIENLGDIKISNKDRGLLLSAVLDYLKLHLEGFTSVKSLDVLREIFR